MVKALLLDKKNQSPAPTPVKAVEESCVNCGGALSYQTCPATTGNVYQDNIQEYISQATTANYNARQTPLSSPGFQIKSTPVFLPLKTINVIFPPPVPQGQILSVLKVVQSLAYQAPAYSSSIPVQVLSKEDFQAYEKANDAVMMNSKLNVKTCKIK
ncbi:hypothetical protein Tco_1136596 [Tanacetum coccineum]